MQYFRVTYINKYGEEKMAPFVFDNIEEARRARSLYQNRGYHSISILVQVLDK
jgi:hypothetical protein